MGHRIRANSLACTLSHIKALKQAKANRWHNVLIFEDDFAIRPDFDISLSKLLANVPNNYDMLYLNGTYGKFGKPVKVNEYISKVNELYGTFAYIVNANFYDRAIVCLEKFKQDLDTDYIYSSLMRESNVYRANKPIAFHHGGFSYRAERNEKHYNHLLP